MSYVLAAVKAVCNKGVDQTFGRSSEEQKRQVFFKKKERC